MSDARGELYQENFRNKLVKWKQIEKEQPFKALPLPEYPDMFVPKKSTRPLTHSEPVVLQTDRRAEEREIYEQERRRKEKLLQDMLAEKAREDEVRKRTLTPRLFWCTLAINVTNAFILSIVIAPRFSFLVA